MADKINSITINNDIYYHVDDIFNFNPSYFYGCGKNMRNILKRKKIDEDEYIFAYQKQGKWIVSNSNYPRAKILFTEEFVYDNIPKFAKEKKIAEDVQVAPPIIELEEHEYFKDNEGNILDVEIRGYREKEELYFNVKDIGKYVGIKRLEHNVTHKKSSFAKQTDYVFLLAEMGAGTPKMFSKKMIFFTYVGIVKYLFLSKSEIAKQFQD